MFGCGSTCFYSHYSGGRAWWISLRSRPAWSPCLGYLGQTPNQTVIKKQEKDKAISEDESKKLVEDVQKATDAFIKKIDEVTMAKEKEIMEI